ncbi:lipase maturation factor 1 isoform X1 [Bufo gargarizans]|uniref:lipase maturation factor 1 isoform X1 n=2 Tax=Bufo gargarizans TaxID=30331 RepID=UPI001CF3BE82|nr:lipase maturation factor 1 isoform X1 [Bufo gargarizans]
MAAPSVTAGTWESGLRRRKGKEAAGADNGTVREGKQHGGHRVSLLPGTYWLTRIVLLRAIAAIYFVAFLVALHQNKQLIGERGLLPCRLHLQNIKQYFGGKVGMEAVSHAPTLLWVLDWSTMDTHLDNIALLGLVISASILITGCANMIMMGTLWILYHSIVSVGQLWYAFGWESQLLETGFLGIFLCPLWSLSRVPERTPPSGIVIWAHRWLIFRIMMGAGLIKIRGDKCWRDLTCMNYHYETQPVPNPLAYYMHRNPGWFHQFETLVNHVIELIAPFFIFMGRRMCIINGILQLLFQVLLILSGNLSFLNWLTIVPSIACFDDAHLSFLFRSKDGSAKHQVSKIQRQTSTGERPTRSCGFYTRQVLHISLGILIAYLSVPVVLNLVSARQVMNASFNPLRIVNTYGAFGSVTKDRTEVIIQGTSSLDPKDPNAVWEEYEFNCKPGNLTRRPCVISPYHYRLDWLMWFAAFQTYEQNEWMIHLAGKLLANEPTATSLLAFNPFQEKGPPRWIRGEHFRYKFTRIWGTHSAEGKWWIRKRIGPYFPPVNLQGLKKYFQSRSWPLPSTPSKHE